MGVSRACYVTCDNCGDPAPVITDGGAREARAVAKGERYTRVRIDGAWVDLCPKCEGKSELDGIRTREWNYGLRVDPATLR